MARKNRAKIKKTPFGLRRCRGNDKCIRKWAKSKQGHRWAGFSF